MSQCHSKNDLLDQIEKKHKRIPHRQSSIQGLLSGFNSRKLNEDTDVAQQMKYLLKVLLSEENLVEIPDESMQIDENQSEIDPTLIEGYREIGLVEL